MKTKVKEIYSNGNEFLGRQVEVEGWIKTNRNQKKIGFIHLTDGTFFTPLQVVYDDTINNFEEIQNLTVYSAIKIKGKIVRCENKAQDIELHADEICIITKCPSDYPLQSKRHTREFLREISHLRPRTNLFQSIFRVRSLASYAVHKFFHDEGFVYIHTPIITGTDAEGAGEMFRVTTLDNVEHDREGNIDYKNDFFGKKSGLAVTGQLEAEALAMAFSKVYTFGPAFRAERSNTYRHLSEFWMIEPEIAFADLNSVMELAESLIKYTIRYVLENAKEEMKFLNNFIDNSLINRLNDITNTTFIKVTYTEAISILEKSEVKFENDVFWGVDMSSEHEKYLTDVVYKQPIFITDYPTEIKAFYMKLNDDNKTVAACDLLVPKIGEIVGGSAREHRIEFLTKKMDDFGIKKEELYWYIDINRFGGVPHGGFGLGFERFIMYLTGIENIRDTTLFARAMRTLKF